MSNVKLPGKAGFVPTVAEWDALVRIAENLAAQVVQAQAERDAARAEVAALRAAMDWATKQSIGPDLDDDTEFVIYITVGELRKLRAALRQPAPAKE